MASSFTVTKIIDGTRETTIKIDITGDTTSNFSKEIIFDPATYTNTGKSKKLRKVQYCLNGFSGLIYWDANTDAQLVTFESSHYSEADFKEVGYLSNSSYTGYTGKILLTTVGLTLGLSGYIILYLESKDAIPGKP
jgi:hypothetical protein